MAENKYALTSWGGEALFDHTVPSGQTVQMRRIEVDELISLGILDRIDSLTALVSSDIAKVQGKTPQDRKAPKPTKAEQVAQEQQEQNEMLRKLAKEPQALRDLLFMIDKIMTVVIIQPRITSAMVGTIDNFDKLPFTERQSHLVYADSVGLEDRMSIFNAAMEGLSDLQQFREESGGSVEDVADVPEVSVSPE